MAEALTSGSAMKLDCTVVVMAASSLDSSVLSRLDMAAQPMTMRRAMPPTTHPIHTFHCRIAASSSAAPHVPSSYAASHHRMSYGNSHRQLPSHHPGNTP